MVLFSCLYNLFTERSQQCEIRVDSNLWHSQCGERKPICISRCSPIQ